MPKSPIFHIFASADAARARAADADAAGPPTRHHEFLHAEAVAALCRLILGGLTSRRAAGFGRAMD